MGAALKSQPQVESAAALIAAALPGLDAILAKARAAVQRMVAPAGKIEAARLDAHQHVAHGLAWLATSVEAVRQLGQHAGRLQEEGRFHEIDDLLIRIGAGEYAAQIVSSLPMSQTEFVRLADFGLDAGAFTSPEIKALIAAGNTPEHRARLVELIGQAQGAPTIGEAGLDETLEAIRSEMQRFVMQEVAPHAHGWHSRNDYIPMEVVEKMAGLGVFGLTIPEEYGGMGLSKVAMCVVSEELSRGYIGVGSLGTRSEIAAELILCGGTQVQKQRWLPGIAAGEILPTAVFTEPNTGSDLASLRTRAVLEGEGDKAVWKVTGNKTWITHPVRADIMTMLVRTDPDAPGYRGLSLLVAEKPRGTDEDPFPVAGLTGGEIEVLGYRGMKEYELAFDGFEVPGGNLLGEVEGQGFKQLMQTFEAARIQTAARAVGVASSALDLGLRYAQERVQFGKALINFPRVADKLALMAAEIVIARQLTYFAAREKDAERRCDLEAGMAKLLAARIAWACADNALQIHGGNGFALEYEISRVLCDARILSIFEGAAEIQAQVIARRLLEA